MASEIWKIGQENNAQSLYSDTKDKIRCGNIGEFIAVQQLTVICNKMNEEYNEIIKDQNEYLVEIDGEAADLENLKNDIDEKIEKLYNEIKALDKKEQDGSITEEEKQELETKRGELNTLMKDSDSKLEEKIQSVESKDNEKRQEQKSKASIARNYGKVTVEKGTLLAETEVKTNSFWRGLFGSTGHIKKEIGKRAVEAGNDLIDKVETSVEIDTKIDKKYNDFKQL